MTDAFNDIVESYGSFTRLCWVALLAAIAAQAAPDGWGLTVFAVVLAIG